MTLKHIIHTGLFGLLLANTWSCKKSETLDVDMSRYNLSVEGKTDLDAWISTNLTDPYNIQLVYRFERNLTDVAKDIAPISLDKVKPTAEAIINIFLKTYEKVAGSTFIKTYTPKQFVLYGSPSYNSNGTIVLGTADGGRRVVLYEMNSLNFNSPLDVSRKMRTIHHEFTHILNQMIAIPPAFKLVSGPFYNEDWNNVANTDAIAKANGFISKYASSQYTEDFAETVAHLLVEGQVWYDAYAKSAGVAPQAILKRKETLVVEYFKEYFNIDFRWLQYEIAKVLHDTYNERTKDFEYALKNGMLTKTLAVNLSDIHYIDYGQSAKFALLWDQIKTLLVGANLRGVSFNLVFTSPTVVQLQQVLTNAAGTTVSQAWYDFNINVTNDFDITFTYFDGGSTATNYANGRIVAVKNSYQPMIDFLTSHTFKSAWMPDAAIRNNWQKYAGFYVKDEPDYYFYGKF